ncbi:MAG: IS110 family transposase [Solirubrobacteraceae bacterium]
MQTMFARVCGLDVHKAQLTACVRLVVDGVLSETIDTFGTTTSDLLALRDWLKAHEVTHVAMESTGVYWKCIYYMLEGDFELLLVNAAHIKHVPGRKTDTIDAAWIAQLLACGLLRGSFVPPKPIRELRDLTRYRKSLIYERSRAVNRLHKLLEDAGVKLSCVATDVMGVSGRAMMRALIDGHGDPDALAELAKGKLRKKLPELRKALEGRFRAHHAFLLERMLAHISELEDDIQAISGRVEEQIAPFEQKVELLCTIPGVAQRAAEVLIAETGGDMSAFPSAKHLASWAGVCPGQRESAGKRKSAKTRKGSPWLRATLIESARAAARTKETYLSERYRQLARRRGDKKAIIAIAHEILTAAWHMLTNGELYRETGPAPIREHAIERARNRAIKQLERLGHKVTLDELPKAA